MATGKDVADVAERVVAAKRVGKKSLTIGRVIFNLTESGWCDRFVRECHEAAAGGAEYTWDYRAATAKETTILLAKAGIAVTDRQRGDVVCFRYEPYGHIAIWLGDGMVAENTSSGTRGVPLAKGHKITPLASVGESRIVGWFRPLPAAIAPALHPFETAWQWAKEMELVNTLDYDPQIGRMLEILRRYAAATTL